MASAKDKPDDILFSNDVEVTSIRVDAKFSGITKDSLDVYPKTLTLQRLNIPLHRFGTWVFELLKTQEERKEIARNMGPIASFIWALRQSYPEISAWVDDPSKCSFVLEFAKEKQEHYLNSITFLRGKLQEQLKEIGDLDLRFIKIIPHKSTSSKVVARASMESVSGAVGGAQSVKAKDTPNTDTEAIWNCRKLKADIENENDATEKLLLQTKYALRLYDMGKIDDVSVVVDEVKSTIPGIEPSQEKNTEILKNLRELSELYENDDKLIESVGILLHCAVLVHKFDEQDDRLYNINTDTAKVCEMLARMYKIKHTCIRASVSEDDEIGRPKQGRRSRTTYSQARWHERRGNQALEQFKFDEALASFNAAVQLQPKEAQYRLDKADVYLAKGQLKSCKNECNRALKLDLSNMEKARALDLLGEVEYRSYRALEAYNLFQKAKSSGETAKISTKISRLEEAFRLTPLFPFLGFDDYFDYEFYY